MGVKSVAFEQAAFLVDASGEIDVNAVYVCVDDPALGLEAGLALLQRVGKGGIRGSAGGA